MKNLLIFISIFLSSALFISSCQKDEPTTARFTVKLTDAPGDFDAVMVEVIGVDIHSNTGGWTRMDVHDSIYDLLQLQDSVTTVLGTNEFPIGKISQVRLILGAANTVIVDGVTYPLALSSQDESGLKLKIHKEVMAGDDITLVIDFDAKESVKQNGNGTYKLKPVLKAYFKE